MTKRCKHEIWTKDDYPDDLICQKCETIWHISDYMTWTAYDLQHHAPMFIRHAVLDRQVKKFAKEHPNYPDLDMPMDGHSTMVSPSGVEEK